MGKLKSLVEQQPSVHKQSNYLNEDPEIQRIYDKAIQKRTRHHQWKYY